jgi:3-methyladenine DNA glycosylase AlkD
MQSQQELESFRAHLLQNGDPKRAESEKAYLKSQHQFYGVKVPMLRKIAKAWLKAQKQAPIADVTEMSALLWDSDWHEERLLATLLLQYRSNDLTLEHIPLIEKMIHEATSWVYLDALATWVIGALIDHYPQTLNYLPIWAVSDNFWVRRAAILAQIPQFRRGEGDFELFVRLAVPMFDEDQAWTKEERFFIRKAIGWALRELAPKRPALVQEFVREYRERMAGLTFREATRKLPDAHQP